MATPESELQRINAELARLDELDRIDAQLAALDQADAQEREQFASPTPQPTRQLPGVAQSTMVGLGSGLFGSAPKGIFDIVETAGRTFDQGVERYKRGPGFLASAYDVITSPAGEFAPQAPQEDIPLYPVDSPSWATRLGQAGGDFFQENVIDPAQKYVDPANQPWYVKAPYNAAQSVGRFIPYTATGAGLALMGATSGAEATNQYLDQGQPLESALAKGGISTISEIATEIGPTKYLTAFKGSPLLNLVKGTVADVAGENVNNAVNIAADYGLKGELPSLENVKQQAIDTSLASMIGGPMTQGSVFAVDQASRALGMNSPYRPATKPVSQAEINSLADQMVTDSAVQSQQQAPKQLPMEPSSLPIPEVQPEAQPPPQPEVAAPNVSQEAVDKFFGLSQESQPSQDAQQQSRAAVDSILETQMATPQKDVDLVQPARRKDASPLEAAITYSDNLAKKYPVFEPAFRTARKLIETGSSYLSDAKQALRSVAEVDNREGVSRFLLARQEAGKRLAEGFAGRAIQQGATLQDVDALVAKGMTLEFTDEQAAKYGLTPKDMEAVRAWDSYSNKAFNALLEAKLAQAESPEAKARVLRAMAEMRKANYVPQAREGDYMSKMYNPQTGEVQAVLMAATEAELKKMEVDYLKQGLRSTPARHIQDSVDYFDTILDDTRTGQETGAREPVYGFSQRMQFRRGYEGYNTDLIPELVNYAVGHSNYMAKLLTTKDRAESLKLLENNPILKRRAEDTFQSIMNPYSKDSEWTRSVQKGLGLTRAGVALMQLGFVPSSPIVNIIGGFPMASALLTVGNKGTGLTPELLLLRAMATEGRMFMMGKVDKIADPVIREGLKTAQREGVLGDDSLHTLADTSRNVDPRTDVSGTALKGMALSEQLIRSSTFVSAMRIARKKGLSAEAAYQYAKDMAYKVGGAVNKADRPAALLGAGAQTLTQMRTFTINQLRVMKDLLTAGEFKALAKILGYNVALGGVTTLPFAKEIFAIAEAADEDPKKKIRQAVGDEKLADALLYGLPPIFTQTTDAEGNKRGGVSISTNIGTGLLDIGSNDSLGDTLLKTAGGVAYGTAAGMVKGAKQVMSGDAYRGAEMMLPRGIRNPLMAERIEREGYRDANMVPMTPKEGKASPDAVVARGLGFPNMEQQKLAEAARSVTIAKNKLASIREGIARDLAAGQKELQLRGTTGRLADAQRRLLAAIQTAENPEEARDYLARTLDDAAKQTIRTTAPAAYDLLYGSKLDKKFRVEQLTNPHAE